MGSLEARNPCIDPLYYPPDNIEQVKQDIKSFIVAEQENREACERQPNLLFSNRFFVIYKLVPIQIIDTYEEWVEFYQKHNFYKG